MKIPSAAEIRQWDAYTIESEPVLSLDLMERAGERIARKLSLLLLSTSQGAIVCGTGNNGGDGLVIARKLAEQSFHLKVFVVGDAAKGSDEFKTNLLRWEQLGKTYTSVNAESDVPSFDGDDFVVDALFGVGLSRPATGIYKAVISAINAADGKVYSIDLPSGMLPDLLEPLPEEHIVKAATTFAIQVPKRAFFSHKKADFVGKLEIVDIGLHPSFQQTGNWEFVVAESTFPLVKKRALTAEKRSMGTALLVGGARGMCGAIQLAAAGCLRSGAGLTHVLAPKFCQQILQTMLPEAICLDHPDEDCLNTLPGKLNYSSVGIGPGLSNSAAIALFTEQMLQQYNRPMVLDADALNAAAAGQLHKKIPAGSILTPHRREYFRLFEEFTSEDALLEDQLRRSADLKVFILLKGPHSRLTTPDGRIWINSTGNPGMAKGGFGDVLTGLITGLLARWDHPETAAILGMYLHGLAADLALRSQHPETLLPSDLLENIGRAYHTISKT